MCSVLLCCVFVFKQKTAYEMRISDWSSDVCSSDLSNNSLGTDGDTGQRPGAAVWNARVCARGRLDRPTRGGVRETICECSPAHDHSEWRIPWRSASG